MPAVDQETQSIKPDTHITEIINTLELNFSVITHAKTSIFYSNNPYCIMVHYPLS